MTIANEIKDIKRLRDILSVAFEEGLHAWLEHAKLRKFIPLKRKKKRTNEPEPVRVRKALERLGPTFIKLGQMLSVRPDLLPPHYINELEKLQYDLTPVPYTQIKRVAERRYGKRFFKRIHRTPLASASIAQVHAATMKSGEDVVIKVRKKGIKEQMMRDIDLLRQVATIAEKNVKGIKKYRPKEMVEEFATWTGRELDLANEHRNLSLFAQHFEGSSTTCIPQVYGDAHEDALVMERLHGTPLHEIDTLAKPIVRQALENGFSSILEQVFVHGLFHGDPHASNILVMEDGKVGFVDFGIVGHFDRDLIDQSIDLLLGIMDNDPGKVVEALFALGISDADADERELRRRIGDAIAPLQSGTIKDVKVSAVLEEVMRSSLDLGIHMPREFALFGKSIVMIEGIALLYYPDFRFTEAAAPFLEKLMLRRYEPRRFLRKTLHEASRLHRSLSRIPEKTARVLDKLERGTLNLEMHDTDIRKLSVELDRSSNRITYGMIVAALLVSGSLTMGLGQEFALGVPVISLISFLAAGFVALVLLLKILFKR